MTMSELHIATEMVGEVAGKPVVLRYGEPAAEYAALRRGATVVDRSHRMRTRIEGAKAAELVTGLVTNDVLALTPGQGLYAAALTAKGKIVADLRIYADAGWLLVDVPPRAAAGWWEMVRKFINPRVARYRDLSAETASLGVFGTTARSVVAAATGVPVETLGALPMHHFVRTGEDEESTMIARSPVLGLEGWEIVVDAMRAAALRTTLLGAGAVPMGHTAFEIARIEAGTPEWGLDIDDATIPQEANFDELHAISYTKGCYVGQETVARVHFRGHVNRHLRGLRFAGEAPPERTQLADAAGKVVGDVRSTAQSPRLGGVGIGMVRREVPLGTTLRAAWEGGEASLDVVTLPFALE